MKSTSTRAAGNRNRKSSHPNSERAPASVRAELESARAEQVIRDSEVLFREFAATVPEIFWIREVGSEQTLYISPAWERITGHPRPRYRKEFFRIIHPDDAERVMKDARDSPCGGVDHKYRIVRPDGSVRWLHFRTFAVRNAAGEIYRIAGLGKDVTEEVRADQDLRQFRAAVDASADLVTLIDPRRMRYVDINDAACRALGYSREELLAMGPGAVFSAPGSDLGQSYERLMTGDEAPSSVEGAYRRKDGSTFPVEAFRRVVASADGDIIVTIARDMTDRKRAEASLQEAKDFLQLVVDSSPSMIFVKDAQGRAVFVNRACAQYYGTTPEEILAKSTEEVHAATEEARGYVSDDETVIRTRRSIVKDELNTARPGEPRWFHTIKVPLVRQDGSVEALGIATDITERKNAEERLTHLAQFDALTGLPNRHLFQDRLAQTMAQARRSERPLAVLFIDLDRFKLVNDTQGHGAGDALLKEAAARLSRSVRSGDTVGRFGGDEFGAILSDLAKPGDASLVAQKLLDALARPIQLDGHDAYITASIGITLYPGDGTDADALIANADVAMYRAKELGRNSYQYFTREMNERALRWVRMAAELRGALEREEFRLHYQAKADLATGKICGFEALLRWQHPERGLVSPAEFIPVLEDTGLIVPVGEWVLRTACAQVKAWRDAGLQVSPVAVNLSVRQFQQKDLEAGVRDILRDAGIDPSLIRFEITESLLMKDPEGTGRTLRGLKDSGAALSVDDFGTGYSSLAYLKRFPLNELKIDRVFIRDIIGDPDDAAIVVGIISLAHSLNLEVVAEGVETEAQMSFLRSHGCDEMQGFYFARPQPAADCAQALLEDRRLVLPADEDRNGPPAVLVVDDNEDDLLFIRRALEPAGYRVLIANSPEAGFDALAKNAVQIVISDHHLPGMTGVEFLAGVRTLHPGAIRIALSGTANIASVREAINEAGIHKYMSKDWDAKRLRAEVRKAYLRRQARE